MHFLVANAAGFNMMVYKVGVAPGPPVPTPEEKCRGWLDDEGKTLVDHDAIWGGAIHFVAAR